MWVSGTEDRVRPIEGEVAPGAHRDLPGKLVKPFFPALAALSSIEKVIHSPSMFHILFGSILHSTRSTLWPNLHH